MAAKPTEQEQHIPIHEKLADRKAAAETIREGIALEKRGALLIGEGLVKGEGTFTAGETAELKEWATAVTRKSWKTCLSYMAIARTQAELPRKEQREKAASLTFEQAQVLAATPKEHRAAVLKTITPTTTPTEAREERDRIVAETLTDDEKKEQAAKAKARETREKEQAAEKSEKLADDIAKVVKGAAKAGDIWKAMSLAAALVNGGRTGEQVAEAIRVLQVRQERAERAVAEKEAADVERGKALAALAPEGK